MNRLTKGMTRQNGFSFMEIVVAIAIFAIGMLALAKLQGNLTRSSANANVRTVATNIAEETIEGLRGFAYQGTDVNGVYPAYEDIATSAAATETRGGIQYTINTTVSDWYYEIASDTFMQWADYVTAYKARVGGNSEPTNSFSDYKLVSVNVTWDDTRPWLIDETQNFTTDTGITLSAVISSNPASNTGGIVANDDEVDLFVPSVNYSPGTNPEIIQLALGGDKFKETLRPDPTVFRDNELVETRFDVITYSQNATGTLFVRREEFLSVSCECELNVAPATAEDGGRRPTVWSGDEYSEANFVKKPYGTPSLNANNQSAFCDVCCKDHHDGGSSADDLESGAILYDPGGTLQEVTSDGGLYVESCALVRKDGFFRVAQDFQQVGVNAFAQDFLDDTSEVSTYSGYVTSAVSTYASGVSSGYESSPPTFPLPAVGSSATDLWNNETMLPLVIGGGGFGGAAGVTYTEQQLRNRGIYFAYIRNDLQSVITCLNGGGSAADCTSNDVILDQTGSTNVLELLPFFDLRLTLLSRWNEVPINNPVDTTNQPIASGNTHSRGVASSGSRQGTSLVSAKGHPGNIGLTDTDPIEPNFTTTAGTITVANTVGDPAFDPTFTVITGDITQSVGGGLNAADVYIDSVTDMICDRTNTGFQCAITGSSPSFKIAGWGKPTPSGTTDRIACSSGLTKTSENFTDINPWAIFSFSGALDSILYQINIAKSSC